MREDINLAVGSKSKKKTKEIIFGASLGFFVISFIAGSALLLYSLALSTSSASLEQSLSSSKGKLAALSNQKLKFVSLNERLNSIRKILSSRKGIDTSAATIVSYIPDSLTIDSIIANDKGVSVGMSSARLSDFDSLLESAIPEIGKIKELDLKDITVGSFSQKGSGYALVVVFNFRTIRK